MEPTGDSPWMFEMSKHSIRSGRLSRLTHSRSSSSASMRRRRLRSRWAESLSSASSAFCWARSRRRRFSPRRAARTSTLEPRSSERYSANASVAPASGGTTISGGIAGALP